MPQTHFTGSKLTVEAGSGITSGTGTVYKSGILQVGDLILTTILVDLTGLNGGGTANDIIGVNGAANCHIGQIIEEECGTIICGSLRCLETPAGSHVDIDMYAADVATGVEDTAATSLAGQVIVVNAGSLAINTIKDLSSLPADGQYLYLASGIATAATFTAGKLLIELWGYRA
jgi:hypothetical protein